MLEVPSNAEGENVILLRNLQGYQLAKEQANRCNRNLLQYGAAIATILGIAAGSGSIFALADSVGKTGEPEQSLPAWALGMLLAGALILCLFLALLLSQLYRTFSLRVTAPNKTPITTCRP